MKWQDILKITTQDGKEIPIIGDLKKTVSTSNNYYTLCLSCDFVNPSPLSSVSLLRK